MVRLLDGLRRFEEAVYEGLVSGRGYGFDG